MQILIGEEILPPKIIYVQLSGALTLKYVFLIAVIFYLHGEDNHLLLTVTIFLKCQIRLWKYRNMAVLEGEVISFVILVIFACYYSCNFHHIFKFNTFSL